MNDFITAIGLVLILEGIPYFVAPEQVRRMVTQIVELPDALLRKVGFVLMSLGLLVVYLIRG